jgi:hypothetical protein
MLYASRFHPVTSQLLAGIMSLALHGAAQAQSGTLKTLYSFTGDNGDGSFPEGGVVIGSKGALYGTTLAAGASGTGIYGDGTVFRLTPPGAAGGAWTETVLHNFMGADGMSPYAALLIGTNGRLYGTTRNGGNGTESGGTAFELAPPADAGGAWTYRILHSFRGGADGSEPGTSLVPGLDGALYGATTYGGGGCLTRGNVGCGTAFELAPPAVAGEAWTETVLYAFGTNAYPSGVAAGRNGVLYLTTNDKNLGDGSVSSLTPPSQAGGPWTQAVISSLDLYETDGVVVSPNGVLYGTSGFSGPTGYGAVYELTPPTAPGEPWTESVLYGFTYTNGDGAYPNGPVTLAPNGSLYGVTSQGGTSSACPDYQGCGTLYELAPPSAPGGAWTETVLYSFTGGADGAYPAGSLAIGANGALYGATVLGGTSTACADINSPNQRCGTVFQYTPAH